MKVRYSRPSDPHLAALLERHPELELELGDSPSHPYRITLEGPSGSRWIGVDDPDSEEFGLIEIIDNNPLVCARSFSVPTAAQTAASIALLPLSKSGLLLDDPALLFSEAIDEPGTEAGLQRMGISNDFMFQSEPLEIGSVLACTLLAAVPYLDGGHSFMEIFEESYGRSFFVSEHRGELDPDLVRGTPNAVYNLQFNPGEGDALLKVRVLLDKNGKGGYAQVVHGINIMYGFEESLPFY